MCFLLFMLKVLQIKKKKTWKGVFTAFHEYVDQWFLNCLPGSKYLCPQGL